MTMGMVLVAFLAARIHWYPDATTMVSTFRRTSSATSSGARSTIPPHIGTRRRCSVLLYSQARAELAEFPRHGGSHYSDCPTLYTLCGKLSSAAAPRLKPKQQAISLQ